MKKRSSNGMKKEGRKIRIQRVMKKRIVHDRNEEMEWKREDYCEKKRRRIERSCEVDENCK